MSDVLDLNALIPESRKIKIGNPPVEIEVPPPTTGNMMRMAALGTQFENIAKLEPAEIDVLVDKVTTLLHSMIPGLSAHVLHPPQMLKLMDILSEMGTPEDTGKKGAKVTADPKAEK